MTKAFIPEIGSTLRLEKDWTFDVHYEYRNYDLFVADGLINKEDSSICTYIPEKGVSPYKRTLPVGSEFVVSRIYVRNGAKDFSSVTLYVAETTDETIRALKPKSKPFSSSAGRKYYCRFWVKLHDFNSADFTVVTDTTVTKTRTGPAKLVPYKICTMDEFRPSSKRVKYWVKFEHDDPELSFDDLLVTFKTNRTVSYDKIEKRNYPHKITTKVFDSYTVHYYDPLCYVDSLIPHSWFRTHANNARFVVKEPGQGLAKTSISGHT